MTLTALERDIGACRACERLVGWREACAGAPPRRFQGERYWGRAVPGFGDPAARILLLGLAPAAHGANRTGRVFTGDRTGDFLFAALHRAGLASSPTSRRADDGMRLHGAWLASAVRCAPPGNKPSPAERDACLPFAVRELAALTELRVVLCLGQFAWDAALRLRAAAGEPPARPRPRFGHGAHFDDGAWLPMIGSFHPSQQNTFTGRLTAAMLDDVLALAVGLSR